MGSEMCIRDSLKFPWLLLRLLDKLAYQLAWNSVLSGDFLMQLIGLLRGGHDLGDLVGRQVLPVALLVLAARYRVLKAPSPELFL